MEERRFSKGEVIFSQGDKGDLAYLIQSGAIEISRLSHDKKSVFGTLSTGQIFGEMALISDQPRTATATAVEDSLCFAVPTQVFDAELEKSSALMRSLLRSFINHVRNMMAQLELSKTGLVEAEARAIEAEKEIDRLNGVEFFQPDTSGQYKKVEP